MWPLADEIKCEQAQARSRTMHPQSHPLTIGGTVLKESDDLHIFGTRLVSPGEYVMVEYSFGDSFGVLSCSFWSTVMVCGARLYRYTPYRLCSQRCRFLTVHGCALVQHCTSSICGSIMHAVKTGYKQMRPLYDILFVVYASAGYKWCIGRTLICWCAFSWQNRAMPPGFLSPSQYLCGPILVALC